MEGVWRGDTGLFTRGRAEIKDGYTETLQMQPSPPSPGPLMVYYSALMVFKSPLKSFYCYFTLQNQKYQLDLKSKKILFLY